MTRKWKKPEDEDSEWREMPRCACCDCAFEPEGDEKFCAFCLSEGHDKLDVGDSGGDQW